MHVWRVDFSEWSLKRETVPTGWEHLGGRGLSARILLDEVSASCDALGPHNKLIFAPGLLVGHMLSGCDRLSVGGKSPLTGGIKEANAGGSTGLKMARLGMKALVLEGQPPADDPRWWVLHLSLAGARFEPAGELAGLGVYESARRLLAQHGPKVALALIGPGGEWRLAAAGIQTLDKDGVPSRIAGRGGLGAVMGAKRLKAIVFDDASGRKPSLAHPEQYRAAQKRLTANVLAHPQTAVFRDYGTAANVMLCNALGALPTRNFSHGQFEGAETLSGERMREALVRRGGEGDTSHSCMAGCVIQCSNTYADEQGRSIVSPLEYETIGLMGSNLGIADLDTVGRMNWEANDLGLDTIELGAALGVAAEAGMLKFGDGEGALQLLAEIRGGTPLGRILGGGAAITGRVFGSTRVPVVKGQAMAAYEPRAIKGTGITYATSPQGADHTAGNTVRAKVDQLDPKANVPLSRGAQINMAGFDTLGVCIFTGFGFMVAPQVIAELLNARYGREVGADVLQVLGKETLALERAFNRQAGFTAAHDRLPEYMRTETLPPHNSVFDVSEADLDSVFNWEQPG